MPRKQHFGITTGPRERGQESREIAAGHSTEGKEARGRASQHPRSLFPVRLLSSQKGILVHHKVVCQMSTRRSRFRVSKTKIRRAEVEVACLSHLPVHQHSQEASLSVAQHLISPRKIETQTERKTRSAGVKSEETSRGALRVESGRHFVEK